MHFRQNKACFLLLYFWVFQKRFVTLACVSPLEVQRGGGILISYNAPASRIMKTSSTLINKKA